MNIATILHIAVFAVTFVCYCLVTGAALLTLLGLTPTRTSAVLTGFVACLAGFELLSLPFMLTKGSFLLLHFLSLTTALILFVLAGIYLAKRKKLAALLNITLEKRSFLQALPYLIFTALVIFETVIPVLYARFDGDDAFYVAISSSLLQSGTVFGFDPSIGREAFVFPPSYSFSGYEVLMTVLAKAFSLNPTVLYHTALPLLYIPMYYGALTLIARALFPSPAEASPEPSKEYGDKPTRLAEKQRILFLIIAAMLTLFGGFSNYLASSFLMLKSWMGKGVMINIVYPVFLSWFIAAFKLQRAPEHVSLKGLFRENNAAYFFLLATGLIAGVGSSAIGIWFIPIAYLCLGIAALLLLPGGAENKQNLILKALLSVIPVLIIMGFYLAMMLGSTGFTDVTEFYVDRTWYDEVLLLFKYGPVCLITFLGAVVWFAFKGNRTERLLFAVMPLVAFLTIANPLLRPIVGKYLTGMPVYWRLFWLYPFFTAIAAAAAGILTGKSRLRWLVLIPLLLICVPANSIIRTNNYFESGNWEKIPQEVISADETIKAHVNTNDPEKLVLLALNNYNVYVRQYDGDISLIMPRSNYVREAYRRAGMEDDLHELWRLFGIDQDGNIMTISKTLPLQRLERLGIRLIITPDARPALTTAFHELRLPNGDFLYIRNDIYKE